MDIMHEVICTKKPTMDIAFDVICTIKLAMDIIIPFALGNPHLTLCVMCDITSVLIFSSLDKYTYLKNMYFCDCDQCLLVSRVGWVNAICP